jgi:hypothetical protein
LVIWRPQHCDVSDGINEYTFRPYARWLSEWREQVFVGALVSIRDRATGREKGQAVRGRDHETMKPALHDESAPVPDGDDRESGGILSLHDDYS